MNTPADLKRAAELYFAMVDRMDLPAKLACFVPDARFTVATYKTRVIAVNSGLKIA